MTAQWGPRVRRLLPLFPSRCAPAPWPQHHTARHIHSALAVEAVSKASCTHTPSWLSERHTRDAAADLLPGNYTVAVRSPSATTPAITSAALGSCQKVHVVLTSSEQLSTNQRAHLTELDLLLQRRVPHTRRTTCSCEGHQRTAGNNIQSSTAVAPDAAPHRRSPRGELFVLSRVVVQPPASLPSLEPTRYRAFPSLERHTHGEEEEVFTGVNHALHKYVNAHRATLRGILKGCAEQNALGAAAASGCAYTNISDVFLLAAHFGRDSPDARGGSRCEADSVEERDTEACNSATQAAAIFPCPECWRHLCHVARERHQHALPPLRLFVCAASPGASEQLLALAQQRVAMMAAPMEVHIVTDGFPHDPNAKLDKEARSCA